MLCPPVLSPAVLQTAVRVLPLPPKAIAEQPAIELPPSVKVTLPVGLLPVTVAVNATLDPTIDGLAELASEVVPAAGFTVCESALLVEGALLPSPAYAAAIECVPTLSAAVLHWAVCVLPDPASATAPQPEIETPPSVKLTAPPGLKPVTEAVNVTLAPATEGLAELASEADAEALFTV
jgi:hypothetical protein